MVLPGTSGGRPASRRGHAADVAVVFAGLVGAAVVQVVDRGPVDAGIARDQRGDRQRGQVVGAHGGQRAAVAAEGGADGVADECVGMLCSIECSCY